MGFIEMLYILGMSAFFGWMLSEVIPTWRNYRKQISAKQEKIIEKLK